jgi:DNA-binding phage protein
VIARAILSVEEEEGLMAIAVDTETLRALMAARGLDVSALAKSAGLSRQALYRFLDPAPRPFSRGFMAVAGALDVSPAALVLDSGVCEVPWREVSGLAREAAKGEPRAFELLPACLSRAAAGGVGAEETLSPLEHQLVGAAAEVAVALVRHKHVLRDVAAAHGSQTEPGRAFFFAADLMTPERIVAATPGAMACHLVFGVFSMADFKRHLR